MGGIPPYNERVKRDKYIHNIKELKEGNIFISWKS